MLKNYFTIAWRNLIKNGTFYFINIIGLSIGLTCCLFISAYLYHELTYDSYPENSKQIYRVGLHVTGNGSLVKYPLVDVAVGAGMKNAFPEIADYTRLSFGWSPVLRYKDTHLKEEHLAMVDSNFFKVFSIPLLAGDDKTAFREPNSIVVTKAFAQKYFATEDVLGKVLTFGNTGEFKVTGLIDKIPDRSHFHYDAFVSMSTFRNQRNTWSNLGYYTYLVLNDHTDPAALQAKFVQLVQKYVVPEVQQDMGVSLAEAQKSVDTFVFTLMPLSQIHLFSHTQSELEAGGDIKYIYIFGALAIFILLLACANFINLSTATSTQRAREVGIRKVLGSQKGQLIYQFLTESILLAFCAMLFAYTLVFVLLPYFNLLSGKQLHFGFFLDPVTLGIGILGILIVGIIAGIYPAFFLSSFKTLSVLKGNASASVGKRNSLRSGLVVFQFAVSSALIVATLVVYQQLHFMQTKKLGYDKDQVLIIEDTFVLRNNEQVFKEQLLKDSRIQNVTISRQGPGINGTDGTQAYPKDKSENENNAEIHINIFHVDYDFLNTLGIKMKTGRNLSPLFPSDSAGTVINEAAVKELGWDTETAVGKTIVLSGQAEYHVVGIVQDFNYASARQKIAPMMMRLDRHSGSIMVKINATDIPGFLEDLKKQWAVLSPETPFAYSFLDQRFSALYFAEERTGQIFTTFASIALAIAALGLFGLSAFTAERRTKEIGVRKVLGASAGQVLFMLSREFLLLVVIAFIIALPIVGWAMQQWLQDFAYRVSMSWWVFALAGSLTLLIAFLSMSFQALRAALANPVESLKTE